jgi:addiction module RelE/StbE family toxin
MRVKWTRPAAEDLRSIRRYIQGDNPAAARRVHRTILERCELLSEFPERGRNGSEPGTKELVFAPLPYIAVYRIRGETIEILSVWHGAQERWPYSTP